MGQINSTNVGDRHLSSSGESPGVGPPDTQGSVSTTSPISASRRTRRMSMRNAFTGIGKAGGARNARVDVSQYEMDRRRWWKWSRRQSKIKPVQAGSHQAANHKSVAPHETSQGRAPGESGVDSAEPNASNDRDVSLHPPLASDGHKPVTEYVEPGSVVTPDKTSSATSKGKERMVGSSGTTLEHSADMSTSRVRIGDANEAGSPSGPSGLQDTARRLPSSSVNDDVLFAEASSSPVVTEAPRVDVNHLDQLARISTVVVLQGVLNDDGLSRTMHDALGPSPLSPDLTSSLGRESDTSTAEANFSRGTNSGLLSELEATLDRDAARPLGHHGLASEATRDPPSNDNMWSSGTTNSTGPRAAQQMNSSPNRSVTDPIESLLSIVNVAATATAASLLQTPGQSSADPFSSDSGTASLSPAEELATSAMAQALAAVNPVAAALLARLEQERRERETSRLRSAWETLRERLTRAGGNRDITRSDSRSHATTGSFSRESGNREPLIPEALFSQIARAFESSSASGEPTIGRQSVFGEEGRLQDQHSRANLPTTFHRFLTDLQSDLRAELTRNDLPLDGTPTSQPRTDNEGQDVGNLANHAGSGTSSTTTDTPAGQRTSRLSQGEEVLQEDKLSTEDLMHAAGGSSSATSSQSPSDMTDLTGTPESWEQSLQADDSPVANANSLARESSAAPSDQSPAPGRGATNRVNWCRIYRFPPMQSSQLSDSTDAALENTVHNLPMFSSHQATSGRETARLSASGDATTLEDAASVIPVLLVGLQSTSSGIPSNPNMQETSSGRTDRENATYRDTSPHTPHDRSSRLSGARAFSRLSRRADATNERGNDASGRVGSSRAFSIYVFGGHYPPGHRILTDEDGIGSFEALWDLAEVLGQVKRHVVTDEDIERSGLELFKAASLTEYESSDRIASNCVERCLICLDEYNPEDDLRLLRCKHAFHKGCVDRWLKTGRNNCPACRSEGVKAESNASTPFS